MFQINFQLFLLSCLFLSLAYSCRLSVRYPYPLFSKNFGSKNITFRTNGNEIELEKGESVHVYCGSGIQLYGYNPQPNYQQQTATIFCQENEYIQAKGLYDHIRSSEVTIYCSSSSSSSIYESNQKLPNCEKFSSYVIGEKIPLIGTIKKLALCYDIDNFHLKYANYIAYNKKDVLISPEQSFNSELEVDLEQKVDNLKNYFKFMSQGSFNNSRDRKPNEFFKAFEFDFDSLLQDVPLRDQFESWTYFVNTMWWRKLRQNNWRFFLDALNERTESEKFQLYVGAYGNATLPLTESSSGQAEVVTVQSDGLVVTAPMYIWAYVKSLSSNNDEEFVVIGHNSPYVEAPDHTQFCANDICDEISWLKDSKFGHLRHIPTFGYTFCCRAEEVAKVVDYFPLSKQLIETTTAAAELTTSRE